MSILAIIPRPVAIPVGGMMLPAVEFTLGDVADLQAAAEAAHPSPFEVAAGRLFRGRRDGEWKRTLARVVDEQAAWSPDLAAYAATPDGTARQIYLCLHRGDPTFTAADAARAYDAITLDEYDRLCRVAWAIDPDDAMLALVDGPAPASPPVDWPRIYHRYLTEVSGPAPPFADLTLGQFRAWARGGRGPNDAIPDGQDWRAVTARRAEFWADLPSAS